jgi:hypothetical protein
MKAPSESAEQIELFRWAGYSRGKYPTGASEAK